MSFQNDESLLQHLTGLGFGIPLILGGLVITIGNIWLGAGIGVPLILLGVVLPVFLSHQAREEHQRQEKRQKREHHNSADGYNISSKSLRRRR